ncbi:hypothetical protein [Chelatococcus reniformis]|uniref:Uncharacterized protein n=1 Tax=Chelatococcus reniformis TaxID=1494448 RepID=A0A916XPV2_9HYPH|nr:hypothetical protein [Chelatococcus reniformis]GGC90564.1 hypothetical protein GCM10010994_55470 [Chelatococcus reniformis]
MSSLARPRFSPHELAIAIDDVWRHCQFRDGRIGDAMVTIDSKEAKKLKAAADLIDRLDPFQSEFKDWLAKMERGRR